MRHTDYTVYFATGETKDIKAIGLLSALVKAMEDRAHLAEQVPTKITDEHGNTFTNFEINCDKN